jgi:hypothetical protein
MEPRSAFPRLSYRNFPVWHLCFGIRQPLFKFSANYKAGDFGVKFACTYRLAGGEIIGFPHVLACQEFAKVAAVLQSVLILEGLDLAPHQIKGAGGQDPISHFFTLPD